jgi:anti-anti-sigma factor
MKIHEQRQGPVTIMRAEGRLDATSAPEADRRLAALSEGGARQIVLDLSGVEYVSSAGLRVFLAAAKRMQRAQGRLALAAPAPQVREILDLAGFAAILPVCETVADAVGRFPAADAPAAPAPAPLPLAHGPLSFAEELFLLALDDGQGVLRLVSAPAFDYALAGALLMELALRGCIDADLARLTVTAAASTGDPLLDEALEGLQQAAEPRPTSFWLKQLAGQSGRIQEQVLARLVQKGILKQESRRILWVFEVRRYPLIDKREIRDVRARLHDLILSDDIPDARDVVLVSLGSASRLLDELFTPEESERAQARIRALARLDLIGRDLSLAVREIERAMGIALMALKL